jgi:YbbR domain-containing protein
MRSVALRVAAHWQLKLLSLALAVGLWAFVASEDRGEAVYTVALEVVPPSGFAVASVGTETVEVRLAGLRSVLTRLRERDLRAIVALRDASPGDLQVRVVPEDVATPPGVRVVRITPSRVRITVEPR